MPLENIAKNHFFETEKQQLDDAIAIIFGVLTPKTYNLTPKERSQYGKVGDQKKLLINKTRDFLNSQPELSSPDIDWNEFEADYQTRNYLSGKLNEIASIHLMLLSNKVLHDRDNYIDVLRDYRYSCYKNKFGNQTGYSSKIDSLKVFFPKTGKKKKK